MQIFSDSDRDISTRKTDPGSYEWWYFDAISLDGTYSFVVIFYQGNPFSRRYIDGVTNESENMAEQYPAVSISIYKADKPIFYAFEEVPPGEAYFSSEMPEGKVGSNTFCREYSDDGKLRYRLKIDQSVPCGDRLEGQVVFSSESSGPFFSGSRGSEAENEDQSAHFWNLVQPSADVDGSLELTGLKHESIRLKGKGYHDHNTGMEPMKESFRDWYWGRFHFSGHTLVYYLMNENNSRNHCAWLIMPDNSVRELTAGIELSDEGMNLFGLKSSRKIEKKTGEVQFLVQNDRTMDNGPFYQRFESQLVLNLAGKIYQARGISEYICPRRIHTKLFRPLVNMRIKYPGNTHWVQQNPHLYRWTW